MGIILYIVYYTLGWFLLLWYTDIRWTLLGNTIEAITNMGFKLNWWFAPINIITALASIVFLIPTLFLYNQIITTKKLFLGLTILCIFLILRNFWYMCEDIMDYRNKPSELQFMYIVIDFFMIIYGSLFLNISKKVE